MNKKKVRDLMIPVNDYATVGQDASLLEAVKALRKSQEKVPPNLHPFRAMLVTDDEGKIIGKIGHLAFLKALEPKYKSSGDMEKLRRANIDSEFVDQMMAHFDLWDMDLFDICARAKSIMIKDVMKDIDECVDAEATLSHAMHKIIMFQTLSLLVCDKDRIVGIIRLSDIYNELESFIIENS